VTGEGEDASVAIAKTVLKGERGELDPFLVGRQNGTKVLNAPKLRDLDSMPFPLRSEDRLGRYLLYDLTWPPASQQHNTAIVLTSRGCLHSCDFCASATVWGQEAVYRSKEKIVREFQELKEIFGTNTAVIIDQSFGQDKEWTLELCKAIKNAKIGINWYHQSNLTIDRDVIKAMAEAGCTKIGFGMEGLSPRAVEKVKPPNPTDFDVINDVFDYCTSLGLFVKAYTMIGFPWETNQSIKEYFEWIQKIRASQIKISYMTPFPGTVYWEKYRDQLVTRNWENFDTVRMPVVHNPHISIEQYHDIRRDLFRAFYDSNTYTDAARQMIDRFPRSVESYKEFADYLRHFDMISGNTHWLD
jgi:anaerobic magnesium-protoporphyrin IX monomethyl ester cyclase